MSPEVESGGPLFVVVVPRIVFRLEEREEGGKEGAEMC